jgi:hypothetical protein
MKADYHCKLNALKWTGSHAHTFLRFPLLSFNAGASSSARPPGPMLLLRVFRDDLRGDSAATGALKDMLALKPSAIFSLPSECAIVVWMLSIVGRGDGARDDALQGKQAGANQ